MSRDHRLILEFGLGPGGARLPGPRFGAGAGRSDRSDSGPCSDSRFRAVIPCGNGITAPRAPGDLTRIRRTFRRHGSTITASGPASCCAFCGLLADGWAQKPHIGATLSPNLTLTARSAPNNRERTRVPSQNLNGNFPYCKFWCE